MFSTKKEKVVFGVSLIVVLLLAAAVFLLTQRSPDMRVAVFHPKAGLTVVLVEQPMTEEFTTVSKSAVYSQKVSDAQQKEDEAKYPGDMDACPADSITTVRAPFSFQLVREELYEDLVDGTKQITKVKVYGDGSVRREFKESPAAP